MEVDNYANDRENNHEKRGRGERGKKELPRKVQKPPPGTLEDVTPEEYQNCWNRRRMAIG